MSIEILAKNESVKYLGQRISFPPTRDTGHQKQDQSSLDDISQIQTGIDIKEIHAQNSVFDSSTPQSLPTLCYSRNMDTEPRTRKNDSIDTTQDATPHHPDEKKIQKN